MENKFKQEQERAHREEKQLNKLRNELKAKEEVTFLMNN